MNKSTRRTVVHHHYRASGSGWSRGIRFSELNLKAKIFVYFYLIFMVGIFVCIIITVLDAAIGYDNDFIVFRDKPDALTEKD